MAKAKTGFTNKSAETNLRKAERLEARAERLLESADRRTKAGKAAVAEAQKLLAQAEKYREKGLATRQQIREAQERAIKEYNADIYNKIQQAMMLRRAKLMEMESKGTRGSAGNEQLMDVIDDWETRLLNDLDGVVDEVYAAFEAAYKKNPDIFNEWIYYSEGSMLTESWNTLQEILERFTGVEPEDEEDDEFEETFV